jgi:hypothetical protein
MRDIQTPMQNLAAGGIGLSPYLIPKVGQMKFAADVAKDPEIIPHLLNRVGEAYKDAMAITGTLKPAVGLLDKIMEVQGLPVGWSHLSDEVKNKIVADAEKEADERLKVEPFETAISLAAPLVGAGAVGMAGKVRLGKKGKALPEKPEIPPIEKPKLSEKPENLEKPVIESTPDVQLKNIKETKPGDLLTEAATVQNKYSPKELSELYFLDREYIEHIVSSERIGKKPPEPSDLPKLVESKSGAIEKFEASTEMPSPERAVAAGEQKPVGGHVEPHRPEKVAEKPKVEISEKPASPPEVVKPKEAVTGIKEPEKAPPVPKGKKILNVSEMNKDVLGDIKAEFDKGGLNVGVPIYKRTPSGVIEGAEFSVPVKTKYISGTHPAFKNKYESLPGIRIALGKAIEGKPLTPKQTDLVRRSYKDWIEWHKEAGYYKSDKVIGNLNLKVGDEVRIKDEWHRVTDRTKEGDLVLKNGKTITVDDVFGRLPIDETSKGHSFIRRNVPVGETNVARWELIGEGEFGAVEKFKATPQDLGVSPLDKKTIGLNKAEIQNIRKNTELDKLDLPERKRWVRSLAEAKESKLNESALTTADEIIASKRPITDSEHSGMVIKAAELKNEYGTIIKEKASLIDKGENLVAEGAQKRADVILDQIDRLTQASDLAGTETARALSIRRMMVNTESFELADIIVRSKSSKGKKLSQKENAKMERLVVELSESEKLRDKFQSKYEKELAEKEQLIAEKATDRETRIRKRIARKKEEIISEREEIKKQIAAIGYRVNDISGISSEGAYLVGKLAVNYIRGGASNLKEVVKMVQSDVPDLKPRDIYQSLISKEPLRQTKAKSEATKNIAELKTQARLLLEIEKVEKGIFEAPRLKPANHEKIRLLQEKLNQLRSWAYRSGQDPRRLEKAVWTINQLQDQLHNQYKTVKKGKVVETAELASAKEKIKLLRKTMRVEDDLAKLNEQLKTGDFEIREKIKVVELPADLERKIVEVNIARKKIRAAIRELAPMTPKRLGVEAVNTLRTLKATADMSAALRQNLLFTTRHPIHAQRNFRKAFKATFDKYTAEQIDNQIRSMPQHYIREKSKLQITELEGIPTAKEEMFAANMIEKIPILGDIIKASNRNMTTVLNLSRVAHFDYFLEKFPNATRAELTAWADWVNICSGRGNLGKAGAIANGLSLAVFAPKFAWSRVQTPFMMFKHWKIPRVRNEIAKDMAALGAVGMTTLSLAGLAGYEVGTDPREADFGKIRIGNTRIDMWGGYQQPMRVLIRIGIRATDAVELTGRELRDQDKEINPIDLIGRFAAYKLAPSVTLPAELMTGKTIVGEPVTPIRTAVHAIIPMVYEDIYDAYKEGGLSRAGLSAGLSFLGTGVNTYEDSKSRVRRDIRKLRREHKYEKADELKLEWNLKHRKNRIVGVGQ